MKNTYKKTILLPKTDFPMRANLTSQEPLRLRQWEESKLYEAICDLRKSGRGKKFILHDGPPYANGDVHMGTALNKLLKDLVLKSKSMAGFYCPYIPGWDCHGLPIEYKVFKQASGLEPAEVRSRAEEFARGYIDIQRESFRRLGVFGDWFDPYITLTPQYEASILKTFAKLVEQDLIYRAKKPVFWSYGAGTALAEAELIYKERVDTSVYVKFRLHRILSGHYSIAIWTTTPWSLPSNVGVAVHPDFNYVAGVFDNGEGQTEKLIIATDLLDDFESKTGLALVKTARKFKGKELEGIDGHHPFIKRRSKLILGEFVENSTGTGAVHISPGHGADDYLVGLEYGLPVLSPINEDCQYTSEVGVPGLEGVHIFDANPIIVEMMRHNGMLIGTYDITHNYPHCDRSKQPVVSRAVEQFFIGLDKLKSAACEQIETVDWLPGWGKNRISGSVGSRPDWCISRQRKWGVPLPAFFSPEGEPILESELIVEVSKVIADHGSNVWFSWTDEQWNSELGLPDGTTRCMDTLDVWIDSGSSSVAVLDEHPELSVPADLYLEATDQHRGWFQSSLMLSTAYRGIAPYKSVLTHGFVVDKDKKKISKSDAQKKGKPTDAKYFYEKYGADIVRLWVASVDWRNEVPFSEEIFEQVTEPYRKFRNTLRILLGNLSDFDPALHTVQTSELGIFDQWILETMDSISQRCITAYEDYEFNKVYGMLINFVAGDLSSVYINITKDRLYCDSKDSLSRRSAQTAMWGVFSDLTKLLAPILCYTADEAWEHAGNQNSVHLELFPEVDLNLLDQSATATVSQLLRIRDIVEVEIERGIQKGIVSKRESAHLLFHVENTSKDYDLLVKFKEEALSLFMVSDFDFTGSHDHRLTVSVEPTKLDECPRCRLSKVRTGQVCQRCDDVLGLTAAAFELAEV